MSRHWEQERLIAQRNNLEIWREEEVQRLTKDQHQKGVLDREESIERKRYARQLQVELKERQKENALRKTEEDKIKRQKQAEQEERLAKELARINIEMIRDEKIRQQIKESSIEIRELESKLKCAYASKGRAAQMAEREAMKSRAMRDAEAVAQRINRELQRVDGEQQRREQKRQEELVQYQRGLGKQLKDRELQRQEAYKEFLREKMQIDEIIRKIYEDDQMEKQLKLEKVRARKEYIEEFKRQQDEWRRMEQEKVEAENRRIVEFLKNRQEIEKIRKAETKKKKEANKYLQDMLFKQMDEERQQREELEQAREEFYLAEQEEADRQKEIQAMEKKIRQRLIMQQTYVEQLALEKMRRKAEKEEEEALRRELMAKAAEDDRIEQMNAQKRRMKKLEHRRQVEIQIEERRRQREAERELEAEQKAVEEERELLRMQIIEEERRKLLKRHATKLLGYLPKGFLREDDLEYLDEDVRKAFTAPQNVTSSDDCWDEDG